MLEGSGLVIEAGFLRAGGFGSFLGNLRFGTPPIELSQRVRGFFAPPGEAVGRVLDSLLELDTASFELGHLFLETGVALVDLLGLVPATVLLGGERIELSFDPSELLYQRFLDRRGSGSLLFGRDDLEAKFAELGNVEADDALAALKAKMGMGGQPAAIPELASDLVDGGITVHTQVVLCPGWNDGDVLERTMAEAITKANAARFDGSDLMVSELNLAFWKGMTDWVSGARTLDQALSDIDASVQ